MVRTGGEFLETLETGG
jgi:hypothetical protein